MKISYLFLFICIKFTCTEKVNYSKLKISGGIAAKHNQFPYQVLVTTALHSMRMSICGGSIISRYYILSAAHCFPLKNITKIYIIYGTHDTNILRSRPIKAINVTLHEDYRYPSIEHDIALIKLNESIQSISNANFSRLPTKAMMKNIYVNNTGQIMGWGKTENGQFTNILQYNNVTIINNEECEKYYPSTISEQHLCIAGQYNSTLVGGCFGDSGGPLVINGTQIGIVVYGKNNSINCATGHPTIFIRVDNYLSWIRKNSDVTITD